ncbi:MAG: ATP synthase F0 subunit C [Bdellovibrionaceae bacterium]|nr:ATP synthase F0 subunit C [Pseudobdellovibrionaceae bacterium]
MKRILLFSSALFASIPALANEGGAINGSAGMYAIAAAVAIGTAAFAGTFAQGKVGASAMEGIARNPEAQKSMFVPMIISLVLIESLVIYALVVAFQLIGKI